MIGGATVEYPWVAASDIVTSVSTTRGYGRVLDQLLGFSHQLTCCRVRVTEGNGRNEGTVPFIPSEGYRALHSGRKALIG